MANSAELRAFDALGKHARLADLVALTRSLASAAALARGPEWKDGPKVRSRAEELKLTKDDAQTSFGNALELLERGPEDEAERALARALWAHAVAEAPPKGRDDEDRFATDVLWLATHTPFDATSLFDRALGEAADDVWAAIADRVRRIDQGKLPSLGRGEALLACAALATSTSTAAQKHATTLAGEVKDDALARVLAGRPSLQEDRLTGEIAALPRGPAMTSLLAVTGVLLVTNAVRLVARYALAYKRPAEVILSETSVRVRTRTELLGRTLRDREILISREGLVQATREVRYPRMGFYVGLLALALGSYLGVRTFVDGVRSASVSLLLSGLIIIAVGIGLDFVFASLAPGAIGRCRVVFVPLRGKVICVGSVDLKQADATLNRLAQRRA
jgi:hypothetical protein